MQPLISVIIPVFNGERYLAEAIDSVLSQTYRPLEVIVVDDGSTDRSAEIAGRFGPPVTYVYQPNGGTASARNRGVSLASADLLAFLDQDDVWSRHKLAYQVEALQAGPTADMVFGQVGQFFSPDWEESCRPPLYCPEKPVPGYLPSALLIKREAFLRVGPFGTQWRVGAWADWYVRAVEASMVSLMLPQMVAWRRLHEGNHGLRARAERREYTHLLKASLDRRRARPSEVPALGDGAAIGGRAAASPCGEL